MSNFFPPPHCGRLWDSEELHSCKHCKHHRKSSTMAFLALKLLHKFKDKKKMNKKNQNTAPLSKRTPKHLRTSPSSAETRNAHSDSSRIQKAFSQVKIPRSKHFPSVKKKYGCINIYGLKHHLNDIQAALLTSRYLYFLQKRWIHICVIISLSNTTRLFNQLNLSE